MQTAVTLPDRRLRDRQRDRGREGWRRPPIVAHCVMHFWGSCWIMQSIDIDPGACHHCSLWDGECEWVKMKKRKLGEIGKKMEERCTRGKEYGMDAVRGKDMELWVHFSPLRENLLLINIHTAWWGQKENLRQNIIPLVPHTSHPASLESFTACGRVWSLAAVGLQSITEASVTNMSICPLS